MQAGKPKVTVPVLLILDGSVQQILQPYCTSILATLQALHVNSQLIVSSLTPTSHALPTHPFTSPTSFLSTLPSILTKPLRPNTTLWRSQAGLLRAIKTGTKLLEIVLGNLSDGGGRGMLPRYLIVISRNDLELPNSEIWLEDEEEDGSESWDSVSGLFGKAPHQTTLFSVLSLGSTPNLESFWKSSTSHLPAHLVASSLVVTPTPLFPLLSGDHTYFLTGFSNARSTSNSTPAVITPASIPDSTKRAAKPEPVLPNKKLRSNAPTMPVGSIPISTIATPPLSSVPLAPQGFTPTQSNKSLQPPHRPPSAHRSPRVPQQVLDGYVENMAVGNTFPNGGPVPTTNFAEVQAALAAYNPPPQQSQPPQQTQLPAPSQASQPPPQVNGNQRPLSAANLTPAQLSSLPQLSPEVMAKIQELLGECKDRLARGEVTKEQSAQEVRQLKDTMDGLRLKAAQELFYAQRQAAAAAAAVAGQLQPSTQAPLRRPSPAPFAVATPNYPPNYSGSAPPQQQQRPPNVPIGAAGASRPPSSLNPPIWHGSVSWTTGEKGNKREITMYCSASPIQVSSTTELVAVPFPPGLRITVLIPVRMDLLQQLATDNKLPAINLNSINSANLSEKIKNDLKSVGTNEDLYKMFAQSMDQRKTCGIAKFGPSPSTGMVILSIPSQNRFVGIVFQKIGIPESWLNGSVNAQPPPLQQLNDGSMLAIQQIQQQNYLKAAQLQQHQLLQQQQQQQHINMALAPPIIPNPFQNQVLPQEVPGLPPGLTLEALTSMLGSEKVAEILAAAARGGV